MSLSLKAELEIWAAALKSYDEQDFAKALDLFSRIADSSKILTNMGLIYATIGQHETAVEHFVAATNVDSYLAIAYFQCGVSNFLLERYDLALLNFEDAYLHLRGNEAINYEQIGLKFKLFSAEIMFNKGLAQINLGYVEGGMADMQAARKQKVTDEHAVIDDAMRDRGDGYTVFSIPVGVLYRPSENKLKNSKSKDYLGKAKLVAASDSNDAFTDFTGVKKLRKASGDDLDNKGDKDKPDAESSSPSRSPTMPAPRTDPVAARPTTLERSRTALPLGAPKVGLDTATILASRRSQSVSDPTNIPPPDYPSRSNTELGRSNSARLARSPTTTSAGAMSPRVKVPQGTAGGITGVDPGGSRAGGEIGTATGGVPTPLRNRPSLRRLRGQGVPQARVVQQSAPQPPLQSLQPGQHVKAIKGVTPLVLPAAPPQAQGGHLTQFYDAYMDAYMDDPTRPPIPQGQLPSTSSPQRQSPAAPSFYQQPQPQEQQRPPAWMHPTPSPVKTSSNTSPTSGTSRAPLSISNAGMSGGGTLRWKPTRRPMTRRVTVCDDDEGDDGFVTGEIDEFEMANIRVKLHYQGDVRGMAIPPTTSFNEFVERVTAKFGTSLMGLGMKFMDEDGTKISLRDESDFELAVETARESARGRSEGKIEVWCVDV